MSKQQSGSWDPVWEKVFSENPWGKYPGESLIQFVARNFYKLNRPEIKILEVGCGTGANIWYLKREGFDAYGIDGSETAIKLAQQRLKEEGMSAHLHVGDIISLPYDDNFFDAVIDAECVYANDLQNTKGILTEIKRVLRPGGMLYSRTLSDEISLGKQYTELGENCYTDVSEGPLKGRGFARLSNPASIRNLYGEFLSIRSIDKLKYSIDNGSVTVAELIVICNKEINE